MFYSKWKGGNDFLIRIYESQQKVFVYLIPIMVAGAQKHQNFNNPTRLASSARVQFPNTVFLQNAIQEGGKYWPARANAGYWTRQSR